MVLIRGRLSSWGLWMERTSTNFSFGNNPDKAWPIKLFPVPGSPINKICLLCFATFLMRLIELS